MEIDAQAREVVLQMLEASFAPGDSESRSIHMQLIAVDLIRADPHGAMTRIAAASAALLHQMVAQVAEGRGATPLEVVTSMR